MTAEEQTTDARKQLAEAESTMLHALASARAAVTAQEDELRAIRAEAERRNDEALTEEQVAEIIQVGLPTIVRMRKDGEITPSFYARSLPRYWRSELQQIFRGVKTGARK